MFAFENIVNSCLVAVNTIADYKQILTCLITYLLTYSVALVRKRTIPTERPLLAGEVSAKFNIRVI
jgi:hypothetical protein